MTDKEKDARKALQCLFLAVDETIAKDVQTKVDAALKEKDDVISAFMNATKDAQ